MKHFFLFAHCVGELKPDTQFYRVKLGVNAADSKLKSAALSLTMSTDYFFRVLDNDTSEFLLKLSECFYPGSCYPLHKLCINDVTTAEFRQLVRGMHSLNKRLSVAQFMQRCYTDYDYFTGNTAKFHRLNATNHE